MQSARKKRTKAQHVDNPVTMAVDCAEQRISTTVVSENLFSVDCAEQRFEGNRQFLHHISQRKLVPNT